MATSGTFQYENIIFEVRLILDWKRIEVDVANNRSKLELTLSFKSDDATNFKGFSGSKSAKLQGTSFTYSGGYAASSTAKKVLRTSEIWVNHNADGTKSVLLGGSIKLNYVDGFMGMEEIEVQGTATLDPIARESDFTAFTLSNSVINKDTTTTINYTLNRKSTAFTQQMTLKVGNTQIATWSTGGTGALTRTLTAAEANAIINAIPSATSGTLTLTMQTKNGSTNIGSLKSRTSAFTLNAAVAPAATNLSVSIAGNGRDKTINKFVQSISKVTASFSGNAGYGASVTSRTIVIKKQSDDSNLQTISAASGTTPNAVTKNGVYVAIATIKDSRGRSASVQTTFTVETYSVPKVTSFTALRQTITTTVNITVNSTHSNLGTSNPLSVLIEKGTTSIYTQSNITTATSTQTTSITNQSDTDSHAYKVTITDSFGKQSTAIVNVPTAFVEMSIKKNVGVGIGKIHENGTLDVAGDVHAYNFSGRGVAKGKVEVPNPGANTIAAFAVSWNLFGIPAATASAQSSDPRVTLVSVGNPNTTGMTLYVVRTNATASTAVHYNAFVI